MASTRHDIYERESGSWGEHDEWWTLVIDEESGEHLVEYHWSWGNPYRGKVDQGSRTMSAKKFLRDKKSDRTAQVRLEELLEELGIEL